MSPVGRYRIVLVDTIPDCPKAIRSQTGMLDAIVDDWEGQGDTLPADDSMSSHAGPAKVVMPARLARGSTVDRYVVFGELGRGAMGTVYGAYDPELDRRVALKFLHPRTPLATDADALADSLLREAQAMARLSHPNVVPVHDVGRHGDGIFIAMGLVEGETLRHWLDEHEREVDAILEIFVAAARGLAAAHSAGVVHRDFKPDNVMVGTDGSVRVLDFGLARTRSVETPGDESSEAGHSRPGWLVQSASTQGLVGTPAYMSPEHLRPHGVDERSDQFSFCVSLFEALYGQRPFEAASFAVLAKQICDGTVRPPPKSTRVPRWLHDCVVRGLAPDPDDRWPSMSALIEVLSRDPATRRRRQLLAVGALAAVAALGAGAGAYFDARPSCADGAAVIERSWGSQQREAVRRALDDGSTYAALNVERVTGQLDEYAGSWQAGYRDACRATHELGRQSDHLLDLRMACLDRTVTELDAFVALVAEADDDVRARALEGASSLTPVARCADTESLLAAVAPATEARVRKEVDTVREQLLRASVATRLGRAESVLSQLERLAERAEQTQYEPILGEALAALGQAQVRAGRLSEAEATLADALWTSFEAGDRMQGGLAASHLAFTLGVKGSDFAEGLQWGRRAASMLEKVSPGSTAHATALARTGSILGMSGDHEGALEVLDRALELHEANPDPFGIAATLTDIAVIHDHRGQWTVSRDLYERVIGLLENVAGPEHPLSARAHANLGLPLMRLGDREGARREMERALAIAEAAHADTHPLVIEILTNFGAMLLETGETEASGPYLERALVSAQSSLGGDNPRVAQIHYCLGELAMSRGRPTDALPHHEQALEIRSGFGPRHRLVLESLNAVALVYRQLGDNESALRYLEDAAAVTEATLPPEHPASTLVLENLADQLHMLGRFEEAASAYTDLIGAIERREGSDGVGTLRHRLGEALFDAGRAELAIDQLSAALASAEGDPRASESVPSARLVRAKAYLATGAADEALADARFAREHWPDEPAEPAQRWELDFTIARAQWQAQPAARANARRLAEAARDVLAADDPARASISAWLSEHPE